MPAGRPTKLTPKVQQTIAELLWLAFSDEQIALFTDLSSKTIQRARLGEFCPAINKAAIAREIPFRKRIWDGVGNWCGAAWFLERKYPQQFAKPEVQLQINTTHQTLNQTLVITAEVAGQINSRVKEADVKITQLLKDKRGGNGDSK